MTRHRNDVDALIVGAGPVGLCCSRLLSRLGVSNRVLERRPGLHTAPQAHVVSSRSLEVFRAAGIDAGKLVAAATRREDQGAILWVHTLAGPVLGRLALGTPERIMKTLSSTPAPTLNIPQHRLEPILFEAARDAGAAVDFEVEWLGAMQTEAGVVSEARDHASGETLEFRSRYVLGCDGAGSPVRHALGIGMEGPAHVQSYLSVFVEAELRHVVREHPGLLFWHLDPLEPAVFIAHDLDSTWIYMHPYDPERVKPESFTPERCRQLVANAIGVDADFEVRETGFWQMTCQVADRYRDRRIFLVGDAAHRFPPTGGMGMNTGMADAFNLAWKIAAVCAGRAGDPLLATYDPERRPVAAAAARQSLENHLKMLEVVEALRIEPGLPPEEARSEIRRLPEQEERRRAVQAAIDAQGEHFDMMGLDLGHHYEDGAVLPDGTPPPPPAMRALDFVPSTRPGCRLPHAWVELEGRRVSTLDLVDLAGPTIICGAAGEGWMAAAEALGLRVHAIGEGAAVEDPAGEWASVSGIGPEGVVVVRPDGHVAWRVEGRFEPRLGLEAALAVVYCTAPRGPGWTPIRGVSFSEAGGDTGAPSPAAQASGDGETEAS